MQAAAGGMWIAAALVFALTHATAPATRGGLRGCDSRVAAQPHAGGETSQVIARAGRRIQLGPNRIDVPLQAVDGASLAKRLDALPPNTKVILAFRDLSADEPPVTQFRVYVELPENRTPTETDPHEAGRIAFFNEVRAGREDAPTSSRTYDITAVVGNLHALGAIRDPLTVSIIPQRSPAPNANAVIGEIELLIRAN